MRMLNAIVIAGGLALGVAGMNLSAAIAADEPPVNPATEAAKKAAEEAAKKAADIANAKKAEEEAAMKKAVEEAAKKAGGQAGQPGGGAAPAAVQTPPANPNAIPVPEGATVKTTDLGEGMITEDIKIGDGYEVKEGGAVVAHYHGTLKDGGKVFDSSFNRGQPASFPLSGVIQGWQKGVPGMKVGGVRRLIIPSKFGYGERGAGADIPANADLVFVIQLVDALEMDDAKVGDGEEVGPQPVCVTAYTMKDAEGKVVASATKEKPYIWIPNEMMGVSMGMNGMKVGGKRTIKIPKEMNQSDPRIAGERPQGVPLTVEVELLAVRNLVPPTKK
jgi:FKBP-type peptidyl-prolyl cis-trans isomerase